MPGLAVLLIEDSAEDVELILRELRRGGLDFTAAVIGTERGLREALAARRFDLIICDYSLPGLDARRCLEIYHEWGLDIPFILVSGTVGEEVAVDAMKAGAHDYVMKGRLNRLVPAVQRELREAELRREHRQASEQIRFLAYFDPVTRLPNQRLFLDELEAALLQARRTRTLLAVVFLDVDEFADMRNALGVELCDRLAQGIAERLRGSLEGKFSLARLGESTFALALPLERFEACEELSRRLQLLFEEPFELGVSQLHVDISLGFAVFPLHGATADEVFRSAGIAVRQAHLKRRSSAVYSREDDRSNAERLALLGELRHAIRERQICLQYQPIMALTDMSLAGVEALVRWQHPLHGLIAPDRFLEFAERSGLIRPLTETVIEQAFHQGEIWRAGGVDVPISVNLSVRNLQDPAFAMSISALAEKHGINAARFSFEVTESVIMTEFATAQPMLARLQEMGFKIAIDDFGTGYSSLAYLTSLPIDYLKLDRTFVMRPAGDASRLAIAELVAELAGRLKLEVIAEGVESGAIVTELRRIGCQYAQGYYFSRPLPPQRLPEWIKESFEKITATGQALHWREAALPGLGAPS